MFHRIDHVELQVSNANASDTEDLNLSINNNTVSTKMYDKRDDFYFVNFPFLDGDVPRRRFYGVYMPQLIRLFVTSKVVINS